MPNVFLSMGCSWERLVAYICYVWVLLFIFPIIQLSSSGSFWPSVCCFRSAWYGASSWTSPAVPCRTGSDSSAPPGTAKSKTWRRCRIYLADRWIFITSHFQAKVCFLFSFFFFTLLDTSINFSLSAPLSFSLLRFSTACWEKSLQERSSVFGTPTLWPSGTTSPPRPPPRTTRKVTKRRMV